LNGHPQRTRTAPLGLCDAFARVTRALEALEDGDVAFAERVLEDLASDLWTAVERDCT
jgi:hypothetical protein